MLHNSDLDVYWQIKEVDIQNKRVVLVKQKCMLETSIFKDSREVYPCEGADFTETEFEILKDRCYLALLSTEAFAECEYLKEPLSDWKFEEYSYRIILTPELVSLFATRPNLKPFYDSIISKQERFFELEPVGLYEVYFNYPTPISDEEGLKQIFKDLGIKPFKRKIDVSGQK